MQGIVESRTASLSESALTVLHVLDVCERPLEEEGMATVAELTREQTAAVLELVLLKPAIDDFNDDKTDAGQLDTVESLQGTLLGFVVAKS